MTRIVATLEISGHSFQEIADKLRAGGYDHLFMADGTIDMYGIGLARDAALPSDEASAPRPTIGQHDLGTSDGGRGYIAEFFAKRLRNHHYRRYIEERLAADFACALARYLSEHDAAPVAPAAPLTNERIAEIAAEFYDAGDGDTEHGCLDIDGFAEAIARAMLAAPTTVAPAAVAPRATANADDWHARVATIMERIPTVARLYYTGLGARRYRRASTQNGPGEPLVHRSHVEREINRLLVEAISAAPTPTVAADAAAPSEDAYVAQRMTETLAEVYATIIGDDARPEDEALNAIERVLKAAQVLRLEVDLYRAQRDESAVQPDQFAQARNMVAQPDEQRMSDAARDVLAERARQIGEEGWAPDRDDKYRDHEMSCAAGCYAMHTLAYPAGDPPPAWPWAADWWKPTTHRRNLIKAGALILAEIERIDRPGDKAC